MSQTADYVNAVVRGDVPGRTTANIVVFCDVCGIEYAGDYIVGTGDDSTTRLRAAREHLAAAKGWQCDEAGDFCPEHVGMEMPEHVPAEAVVRPPGSFAMKRAHTYASIFINAGEEWRSYVPVDATLGRDDDLHLQGVHMERGKQGGWRLTENDESWIITTAQPA